ncbi:class I SAM-dependent methyltransferase [Pararhodonellum marinum]|uniref:class I SAM-dependent methyltransferase n=1 Tax=Pararhodonellum marinum TaxID=2755358 RepID=UPI0018900C6C|nr:class I SAM-dependent methyltransferase [Pararhodonellum marinum]
MNCRNCNKIIERSFVDLGHAPPSNSYLKIEDLAKPEKTFPLRVMVCEHCWMVQTEDNESREELFHADYAYFSSTSSGWLKHAECYVDMIMERLKLGPSSLVIEVASNDGYLLKNFVTKNIPCLGIEPTLETAEASKKYGIPVISEFFGNALAKSILTKYRKADLIVGNNVYAHVPDIHDFTQGMKTVLNASGTITLEFPHFYNLLKFKQFDTIYHEHFSYLTLSVVSDIFHAHGLKIFDVEELSTHGGSLRVYGCHEEDPRPISLNVDHIYEKEFAYGLQSNLAYDEFQSSVDKIKNDLLLFLIKEKQKGKSIAAYGAAAKGNTLLNYAGLKTDLISFVYDAAPSKQGKLMPGSHIPILPPTLIQEHRPDWVLILPWNIAEEIQTQYSGIKNWGGKFFAAIPEIRIFD